MVAHQVVIGKQKDSAGMGLPRVHIRNLGTMPPEQGYRDHVRVEC